MPTSPNPAYLITQKVASPADRRAPRVLTVLPDFPYPATTGLHLRMVSNLELVHRLGCFSSLLYFSTEDRDPLPVESTSLAHLCDEVRHGGRRFPQSDFSTAELIGHKIDFLLRGALGLPGHRYPFSMRYDRIGAQQIILAEAQNLKVDFVSLPSILMHYAPKLRSQGFGVIIDAADVLTNLSASFLKNPASRAGKLSLYANYLACRAQERIFLNQCGLNQSSPKQSSEVWATSDAEAAEFRRIAPQARVLLVPNALDEREIRPAVSVSFSDAVIGFIGTYSYAPNLDAARFLAEQVFPSVLAEVPGARLRLAGAGMASDAAAALRALKGVEVLGRVADSGQFMDDCSVLALPVFIRGGVPLKLIEAMARGKAVVASPELIEGLALIDGQETLVRSQAKEFAEAIVRLLKDANLRQKLGTAARENFVREFSIASAEVRLRRESALARCVGD